jgi:hypothetical protein
VEAIIQAVKNGECKGCPVEGIPYTPNGQFRPVKVARCKCTMSAMAAQRSIQKAKCLLCNKSLKTDATYEDDHEVLLAASSASRSLSLHRSIHSSAFMRRHAKGCMHGVQVLRVSEAEGQGICMPEIDAAKLKKKTFISRGGEGAVWSGELEGRGPVAIKTVTLQGPTSQLDRTQVRAGTAMVQQWCSLCAAVALLLRCYCAAVALLLRCCDGSSRCTRCMHARLGPSRHQRP